MSQQTLTIERTVDAPVSKVWKAITDKAQMKEWYFDLSDFKPEAGFEFQFAGKGAKGEDYLHLCRITELVPEKEIAYSWRYDGLPGHSVVSFELFSQGQQTRVKLTHEGLESFAENGPDFAIASFTQGWTMLIGTSLKDFVEK